MKRIWKKLIPCILIFTILFNFSGSCVFATNPMSNQGTISIIDACGVGLGFVVDGIVGILVTFINVVIVALFGAVQGILTAIAYADGDQGMIRFCYSRRYIL